MLGDGGIALGGSRKTPMFSMTNSPEQLEWLRQIQSFMAGFCVETKIGWVPPCKLRGEARYLHSRYYDALAPQETRWYAKQENGVRRKKRVPEDVRLTPVALAQWYFGDGTVSYDRVKFCTNGFTRDESEFLRERLTALYGWTPKVGRDGKYYVLWLRHKADVSELQALVAPYAPTCMQYKLHRIFPGATKPAKPAITTYDDWTQETYRTFNDVASSVECG